MSKSTDAAYAAGFLDGEGTIYILLHKPGNGKAPRSPSYILTITLSQTQEGVLGWLKERWGGSVSSEPLRKWGRRPIWAWRVSSRKAASLLTECLPYLQIKKRAAEIAIEFQAGKRPHGGAARWLGPLTEEEIGRYQTAKEQISLANRGLL